VHVYPAESFHQALRSELHFSVVVTVEVPLEVAVEVSVESAVEVCVDTAVDVAVADAVDAAVDDAVDPGVAVCVETTVTEAVVVGVVVGVVALFTNKSPSSVTSAGKTVRLSVGNNSNTTCTVESTGVSPARSTCIWTRPPFLESRVLLQPWPHFAAVDPDTTEKELEYASICCLLL